MNDLKKRCYAGVLSLACLAGAQPTLPAGETAVTVHAGKPLFRLSGLMIGANMEDLHYQMAGGFDSQMLHGESFFEHSPTELAPLKGQLDGFANVNGEWSVTNGEVTVELRHGGGTPWLEGGLEGGQPPVPQRGSLAKDPGTRLTSLAPAPGGTVETRAAFRFGANAPSIASLIAHVHPNHSDSGWNWYSGYTVDDLADCNTESQPERIKPVTTEWPHGGKPGARAFPPHSFTVVELSLKP